MPLGAVPPEQMKQASTQVHLAIQWLGRFARGYLPPAPDDSHSALIWQRDARALVTGFTQTGGANGKLAPDDGSGILAFGLRPADMTLLAQWDNPGNNPGDNRAGPDSTPITLEFPLHARSDMDAREWMRDCLKRSGLNPAALDAPSPYSMPDYTFSGQYDAHGPIAALSELTRYFDNAELVLEGLRTHYSSILPGPSDIRLWPHHFDMAIMITLEGGDFETARAIGAGLAMPDKLYTEFYWYTYPWPRHTRKGLPKLKSAGTYQTEGFNGAVLPMSRLLQQKSRKGRTQATHVTDFFEETTAIFKSILDKEMTKNS